MIQKVLVEIGNRVQSKMARISSDRLSKCSLPSRLAPVSFQRRRSLERLLRSTRRAMSANFRPASVLNILSKVLESLVKDQVTDYLEFGTLSRTATRFSTPSKTATRSRIPYRTATRSQTPSPTATKSKTPSPTATRSKTPSRTATRFRSKLEKCIYSRRVAQIIDEFLFWEKHQSL